MGGDRGLIAGDREMLGLHNSLGGVSPIFVKSESYNVLSFAEGSQNIEMGQRMFTVSCLVGYTKAGPEGTPQDGLT